MKMVGIDGYAFHFIWIIVAFLAGLFFLNVLAYWHSKRPRKYGSEGLSISRLPTYGFLPSVIQENKKMYFSVVHADNGAEYEVPIDGLPKLLKILGIIPLKQVKGIKIPLCSALFPSVSQCGIVR